MNDAAVVERPVQLHAESLRSGSARNFAEEISAGQVPFRGAEHGRVDHRVQARRRKVVDARSAGCVVGIGPVALTGGRIEDGHRGQAARREDERDAHAEYDETHEKCARVIVDEAHAAVDFGEYAMPFVLRVRKNIL